MIAYNKKWLANLIVRAETISALEAQCISQPENDSVFAAYPAAFYSPNRFVRIGLFILTFIIVVFSLGLFSLLFISGGDEEVIGSLILFFGLLIYGGLELIVKKRHYRSGVDDALLWMTGASIASGLNIISNVSWQTNALIIFILAVFLFLRFINTLMAGIACVAALAIVYLGVIRLGETARVLAPFVVMLAAAGIYWFVQKLRTKEYARYYSNGLVVASVVTLVCFYLAGNYYMVMEAQAYRLSAFSKDRATLSFGWVYWILTLAIPIIYLARGLQKKDLVLLRVGLLLVACTALTLHYYYHIMPAETILVIIGILLIALAYSLIKYLHEPRHGFTHKETGDPSFMDRLQVESLVIVETLGGQRAQANAGTQFGGGTGEGGGASGGF
ncbi:MAG: hypothetical protein ABI813_11595 [Bacteroidota bacterium]